MGVFDAMRGPRFAILCGFLVPLVARADPRNLAAEAGALRAEAAEVSAPGAGAFTLALDFFHEADLLQVGDAHDHAGAQLAVSLGLARGLDAGLSLRQVTDAHQAAGRTEYTVIFGDPTLRLKWAHALGPLALGLSSALLVPTGNGFFDTSAGALTWLVGPVLGVRARRWRLSANADYLLDGRRHLYANPSLLAPYQRFARGITQSDSLAWRGAIELAAERVAPLLELSGEQRLGAGSSVARLSIGLRVELGALEWLIASDLGLVGTSASADPPEPAYAIFAGASVRFDLGAAPAEVPQAMQAQAAPDPPGRVRVRVLDRGSGEALGGAEVEVEEASASALVSDGSTGSILTFPLAPGRYHVRVRHGGFAPARAEVIVPPGATIETTVSLGPAAASVQARVEGRVTDLGGKPIAAAVFTPALEAPLQSDADGRFSATIEPGVYEFAITARGFRTQRRQVRVQSGEKVILNVEMRR